MVQAGLEFIMYPKLASNWRQLCFLSLPGAGIAGLSPYVWFLTNPDWALLWTSASETLLSLRTIMSKFMRKWKPKVKCLTHKFRKAPKS